MGAMVGHTETAPAAGEFEAELLSIKAAARVLGLPVQSVYRLARQDKLPVLRLGDRRVLVLRRPLLELLRATPAAAPTTEAG
jgi:excisionase family DNA binding protein